MQKKSIAENFIYNSLYQIFTLITPFVTAPYVSRVLGADGIGRDSYTNAIVSYFLLFAVLGTNVYGQQEVAKRQDNKEELNKCFWEIFVVRFICISACIVSFIVFLSVYNEYKIELCIRSLTIIALLFDLSWFFQGIEEFKLVVVRNILVKLVSILCIFVFVKEKDDIYVYILILSASILFGNLSFLVSIKKYIKKPVVQSKNLVLHLKNTVVFFIPQIAYTLYGSIDKLMIGIILKSNYDNGYYDQAHKIIMMATSAISGLNVVMRTRVSYLSSKGSHEQIRYYMQKSYRLFAMLALPMITGIILIAEKFVPLFYGPGYEDVILLLKMFAVIIYSSGLNSMLGIQYLTPMGMQGKCNIVLILAAVINIALNISMIENFGCAGAVVASVVAESFVAAAYVVMSKNILSVHDIISNSMPYLFASGVMGVGYIIIDSMIDNLFVNIPAAVIIYFLILCCIKDKLLMEILNKLIFKLKLK